MGNRRQSQPDLARPTLAGRQPKAEQSHQEDAAVSHYQERKYKDRVRLAGL